MVSIHALLAECDDFRSFRFYLSRCFNPRTPCGVRLYKVHHLDGTCIVSIHALLAECDAFRNGRMLVYVGFNPRTPCGVRLPGQRIGHCVQSFQSTHSLRSATRGSICLSAEFQFQSTHSLRSATSWDFTPASTHRGFNPRTPCGVRHAGHIPVADGCGFNPRTPCGVRLNQYESKNLPIPVSIHALLAECDTRTR